VPDGAVAGAGIGCHFMAKWMDRSTEAYTHMGGEGANWIGEAPFSTRKHVFQNLGEGTYNHSGILAIRAAVAAKANITYKILFNDAVAMTGGQHNEGDLDPARIAHEVKAIGVENIALVYDPKEEIDWSTFPKDLERHERDDLMTVQERFQELEGVSAIIYIQTCAAENAAAASAARSPISTSASSSTPMSAKAAAIAGCSRTASPSCRWKPSSGRKRAIDQSTCNKDFSCLKGFCPSFVTVEGGTPKKEATAEVDLSGLPEPAIPAIDGTHNIVITGVGGTGVVTIGAVTSRMAAHIEGKGAAMMEMAGLAQKGGAVHIHVRMAERPEDISAIRVATGECNTLIGGDLVVSAGAKTLGLMTTGLTGAVVNSHEIVTGDFTRNTEFRIPGEDCAVASGAAAGRSEPVRRVGAGPQASGRHDLHQPDASGRGLAARSDPALARGDPQAVELNGAAVERNKQAFEMGRWAIVNPEAAARLITSEVVEKPKTLDEKIAFRADHLTAYQGKRLAKRYRKLVDTIDDPRLKEAVAKGYHKLLAYKDEYEVARLHLATEAKAREPSRAISD
jgi:indolepyruvate ferredoxin oxidoreductase